ncbi:methanogenesis marker 8 protein [Methanogenium cariaci]|jgi:putative methanogenesis marker protein 8
MTQGDEHIIEAAGRARVVVRNGQVVSVGPARITSCPLAARFSEPVRTFSEEEIQRNIEGRIATFGMCTPERVVVSDDDFVLFGASELLSSALRCGIIGAAVIACDGAGTVIATSPRLIQGIGGKMSGLVSTTPIPAVIDRIGEHGGIVVSPHDAALSAESGMRMALEKGFHAPAVTTASADEATLLRGLCPAAFIVAVHTTGTTAEEAEMFAASCDLIFPCASRAMYEIAGKKALLQGGKAVPVFAMTAAGKEVVLAKIASAEAPVVITGRALPYSEGKEPSPLQ